MKSFVAALALLVAAGLAYLLLWPVPVEPVAWTPPPAPPLAGPYAPNDRLKAAERLAAGVGHGPEALAFDAQGRIYTGYVDGRVMRFEPDGSAGVELVNTGGRPLGLKFAPDGRLLVADADKGLLHVDQGRTTVLALEANGVPFRLTDDLDVSGGGVVYFTDASWKFGVHDVMADFIEHGANGRLLRHDLNTGQTDVLASGLHFPNGVALGPDEAFLVVNETAEYRLLRYWLKGDKAGTLEPFLENLPGLPDNVTFDRARNRFWVALYSPRVADLDALLPHPFVRKMVFRLPAFVQPAPVMHGFVLGVDPEGRVVANLQDPGPGAYAPITSAIAHGDFLYLGSLVADAFARVPLGADE